MARTKKTTETKTTPNTILTALMEEVYELMQNPASSKSDIIKFIKDKIDSNPEIKESLGSVTDDIVDNVERAEIDAIEINEESKNESYVVGGITLKSDFKVYNIAKMDKALKQELVNCPTKEEARFLEDIYYQSQRKRINIQNQIRALEQGADSELKDHRGTNNRSFLEWHLYNTALIENECKKALELFSGSNYLSRWAKQIIGIGSVISTCLVANLELKEENGQCVTHASSWWDYCGLNNNRRPWLGREKAGKICREIYEKHGKVLNDEVVMEISAATKWKYSYLEKKGKTEKGNWSLDKIIAACAMIPYNKNMKVLMYKIGHSFLMQKNNPESLYGRLLKERLDYEIAKNENGDYADQAAEILASKNFNKSTTAYKCYIQGKLPPAHLSQRAQRYVTKMFISHLFEAAYWNEYGKPAPEPYVLKFCEGHTDYIGPEVPYDSIPRDCEMK